MNESLFGCRVYVDFRCCHSSFLLLRRFLQITNIASALSLFGPSYLPIADAFADLSLDLIGLSCPAYARIFHEIPLLFFRRADSLLFRSAFHWGCPFSWWVLPVRSFLTMVLALSEL